tara:strand:+ start:774 stop:1382 length:609 start_codon:yes stop_codon:yes gene_type:complete
MVRVNVMKPTGVDVITSAEDDVSIDIRPTIGVKITQKNLKDYVFELTTRETLNGDILIYSHKDIDIVLMQEKKKIVAFAKDMLTENVYGAESRLFEYLRRRGIIAYDSIQGGNIYGSMEAKILESKTANVLKSSLVVIAEWFREEEPIMREIEDHEEMMNDAILNPDDEHATELGEVPHEKEKGSILQRNMFAPYLYGRYTY